MRQLHTVHNCTKLVQRVNILWPIRPKARAKHRPITGLEMWDRTHTYTQVRCRSLSALWKSTLLFSSNPRFQVYQYKILKSDYLKEDFEPRLVKYWPKYKNLFCWSSNVRNNHSVLLLNKIPSFPKSLMRMNNGPPTFITFPNLLSINAGSHTKIVFLAISTLVEVCLNCCLINFHYY